MNTQPTMAVTAAALAAVLAAGCAHQPVKTAIRPAVLAPTQAIPASPSPPPLTGLALRAALTECAAQIEVGAASGHDYSKDSPHSRDLPRPCRPLGLSQLIRAIGRALADMRNG